MRHLRFVTVDVGQAARRVVTPVQSLESLADASARHATRVRSYGGSPQQPCLDLSVECNGSTIEWSCCQEPEETIEQWLERCRDELAAVEAACE